MFSKVIGENRKKNKDDHVYEVGVYLYTCGTRNKNVFRKGENWWLMEATDIIRNLEQPTPEKVTDKRIVYHFKDIDP